MEVYGEGVFSFRYKNDLSYALTVNGFLVFIYDIRFGHHVYKLYESEKKEHLIMTLMDDFELLK